MATIYLRKTVLNTLTRLSLIKFSFGVHLIIQLTKNSLKLVPRWMRYLVIYFQLSGQYEEIFVSRGLDHV